MRPRFGTASLCAAALALGLAACGSENETAAPAKSADIPEIFKQPIPIVRPDESDIDQVTEDTWTLLDKASKKWRLCFSFPTMKDPYWTAADYGAVTHARRLGIELTILDAGGYDNLSKQVSDLEDCQASGADAVLLSAISGEGVKAKVDQLVADGLPVIESVIRVDSPNVTARSVLDFKRMGLAAGEYLKEQANGEPLRIAWFPGPEGASWAVREDEGLKEALAGSNIEIVATRWGDTGRDEQLRLIEDTLQAEPDLDWIVGISTAAEAAPNALKEAGREDEVKVAASYQSNQVGDGINAGDIDYSGNDNIVWMSAMAVDLAVRYLDGEEGIEGTEIWPQPGQLEAGTPIDPTSNPAFAPPGFQPVFQVG